MSVSPCPEGLKWDWGRGGGGVEGEVWHSFLLYPLPWHSSRIHGTHDLGPLMPRELVWSARTKDWLGLLVGASALAFS